MSSGEKKIIKQGEVFFVEDTVGKIAQSLHGSTFSSMMISNTPVIEGIIVDTYLTPLFVWNFL